MTGPIAYPPTRLPSRPEGRLVAIVAIDSDPNCGYEVIHDQHGFRVWRIDPARTEEGRCWSLPSEALPQFGEALALASANAGWGVTPQPGLSPDEFPAVKAANVALMDARAAWQAQAPDFPEDGACPVCGATDWKVVTDGYSQFVRATFEPEPFRIDGVIQYEPDGEPVVDPKASALKASTDGWDDMSEDGDFTYVSCVNFDFACSVPEILVWT